MKNILIIVMSLLSLPLLGQDYQQEYLQGKEFLKDQKYSLAMESFKPLVKVDSESPLSKYAMYYYAVAAYKDGFPALAKDMLLQIKKLYPQWEQMDEVNLWLAKLYFEDKRYNQALASLKATENESLAQQSEAMIKYHLSLTDDIIAVSQLYEANPKNRIIASRYAQLLSQQPLESRDQETLTAIIDKFDLDPKIFNAEVVTKSVFKDTYRVAVMLPFVFETLEIDIRKKKNQFVLDMHNGIKMALEDLQSQGIDVQLYAYDTRRDYGTTKEILEKEELKTMDVIIGPLYPEPLQLVQEFAFQNKINMINPVTNNPAGLSANPYYFLFKPSYHTIGKAMAEYAASEVANPYGIIFYGESESDSILAHGYKATFEKDSLHKIVLMERIESTNARRVLDVLTTEGLKLKDAYTSDEEKEIELTIPEDSIGSIYVASDEGLIITRVLSGIETRKDTMRIFGSERWMDIKAIDYAALERLKVAMAAPAYYNPTNESFVSFRNEYITTYKDLPSEFAILGYDVMMFLGKALNEHGKYFQVRMKDLPMMKGTLYTGYNYSSGSDNMVVPIVEIIDYEPQIVVIKNYATDQQK